MRTKFLALFLLLFSMGFAARAEDADEWSAGLNGDPMKDAQKSMADPKQLESFAAENPEAKKTLDQVNAMTKKNPQMMQKVNKMASELFSAMAKKKEREAAAGKSDAVPDPENLQNGQADGAAFLNNMTPEQRAKLEQLGKEMQGQLARDPASAQPK